MKCFVLSLLAVVFGSAAFAGGAEAQAPSAAGAVDRPDLLVSPARMRDWNDWRFGMFIHWGPWSQTQIGYIWKIVLEDPLGVREKRFELDKTFNPVRFDPKKWARAAREAGMKYVVFVAKHHDGFNNYDTALSDYKITSPEVPYSHAEQPDITRAVVDAFRAEGLAIGFYFSHIDWHHPDGRYFSRAHWDYDPSRIDKDPASWARYVAYEKGQLRELLTKYGKIDLIWFDIHWPHAGYGLEKINHPQVRKDVLDLLTMMKTLQPDIIYNDRGTDLFGAFSTPEQRIPETGLPGSWESNITITNERGFWYKGDHVSAKSPKELVRMLVDIASKGGNFLMNVGPRPDGELSPGEYTGLAGVGEWMQQNHDSIYGTTRGLLLDTPWGRTTTKGRTIYLQVFDWPTDGKLRVLGLLNHVAHAYLLADAQKRPLVVSDEGSDKVIVVPSACPDSNSAVVVLELEGEPAVKNSIRQHGNEAIELPAVRGEASGAATYNHGRGTRPGNFLEHLSSERDQVSWSFEVARAGAYRLDLTYAAPASAAANTFEVLVDGKKVADAKVRSTGDWQGSLLNVPDSKQASGASVGNERFFALRESGQINLTAGEHVVLVRPKHVIGKDLFLLRSILLTPLP